MVQTPDSLETESDQKPRPKPALGVLGLSCSLGAILCFFIGLWIIKANTPPPPPPPPPISMSDVTDELKRELAEESSKVLESAKQSIKEKWSNLRGTDSDDAPAESIDTQETLAVHTPPPNASPSDNPVNIDIETGQGGFRFGISLGSTPKPALRPAWLDTLEQSLLYLIFGGSALGVVLGLISQARGEYPAWGVAAEAIGTCSIGLMLLAIWVALIVALAVAAVFAAVLAAIAGGGSGLDISV